MLNKNRSLRKRKFVIMNHARVTDLFGAPTEHDFEFRAVVNFSNTVHDRTCNAYKCKKHNRKNTHCILSRSFKRTITSNKHYTSLFGSVCGSSMSNCTSTHVSNSVALGAMSSCKTKFPNTSYLWVQGHIGDCCERRKSYRRHLFTPSIISSFSGWNAPNALFWNRSESMEKNKEYVYICTIDGQAFSPIASWKYIFNTVQNRGGLNQSAFRTRKKKAYHTARTTYVWRNYLKVRLA